MSNKKSKPSVQRVVTRRQQARWRLERRNRLITLAVGLSVMAVVAGILAYGYFASYYIPPRQAAVRVNDRVLNMTYVASIMRVVTWGGGVSAASLADEMPRMIQDAELTRQGATAEGIAVTDQEIDEGVRSSLGPLLPTPEEEPDAAKREADFQKLYAAFLKQVRVSDRFYREIVAADVLKDKLQDKLAPRTAEQVHILAIMTDSLEKATEVKTRLDAGEDFATLAKELSLHPSAENGGDMDWIPRGIQDPKLDEVAFSLEPGTVSDPFRTSLGFWVIKAVEKEPDKELSQDNYETLRFTVLNDWLDQQRQQNRVESYWSPAKSRWLQNQFKT